MKLKLKITMKYSLFLDKMKIRGQILILSLTVFVKMVDLHETDAVGHTIQQ